MELKAIGIFVLKSIEFLIFKNFNLKLFWTIFINTCQIKI
jgi:hypothetical protein